MEEWATAVAPRLTFVDQSVPAGTPALGRFMFACLDLLERASAAVRLVNHMAAVDDAMPLAAWRLALSR